jgi:hypothetical protein
VRTLVSLKKGSPPRAAVTLSHSLPISVPPPASEEVEVIFGQWLRSGAEPDVAPIPLPWVLSRAHQALNETEAAIRREWEVLESEHQCLSDWRTQLEERIKAVSR